MGVTEFFLAVASVIVGNVFTLLAVYVFWSARKLEQKGHSANNLPASALIAALMPFGVVIWAALLLE